MRRRGSWKLEILLVVGLIAVLAGLAVVLTLYASEPPSLNKLMREESWDTNKAVLASTKGEVADVTQLQDIPKKDQKEIATESGLKYIEQRLGDGNKVKVGSIVEVYYTGTLKSDGSEIDSNVGRGQPYTVVLGANPPQVIRGWEEGLLGMKSGGKRKLLIPAHLGYGDRGSPPKVPPKADLVFEIEIVKVTNR